MKAKTELQKLVVKLSAKLPALTPLQKKWGLEHCLNDHFCISRKTFYYLECGHSWKSFNGDILLAKYEKQTTCPECHRELKLLDMKFKRFDSAYYGILTTKSGFQVERLFIFKKRYKKHMVPEIQISEVMQHWMNSDGKLTMMALPVNNFSAQYDQWIYNEDLELSNHTSYRGNLRASIIAWKYYPTISILPIVKRNGFKGNFYKYPPHKLFSLLITNPKIETLLKAKQFSLLDYFKDVYTRRDFDKYWPTIKIALRNNYIVPDAGLWFDYLSFLASFNKDLKNAFYVCPDNLKLMHDKLSAKRWKLLKAEEDQEKRRKANLQQKQFLEQKGKFLNLVFSDGEITVKPLQSVQDFIDEGDKLHHCVYSSNYFNKENSLILSARIDDEPIETIEFTLDSLQIRQCRGKFNDITPFHEQILNLIQNNASAIAKKAMQPA